jgi:peptidoglycan/LPS O-acetylase OafA/YrhL
MKLMRRLRSLIGTLPQRLLRVTAGGKLIPEIDGLRFVAVLAVVLYHLNGYLMARLPGTQAGSAGDSLVAAVCSVGHWGVQLFFAISGFIIVLPLFEKAREGGELPALGTFYRRRFARLMPPYAINLVLFFLALLCMGRNGAGELMTSLIASLLYSHQLVLNCPSRINVVAWSLEVEIQFYLLAPFLGRLLLVLRPWTRRIGLAAAATAFVYITGSWRMPSFLDNALPFHIQYFLVGILLADIWVSAPDAGKSLAWDAVGWAAWAAILLAPHFVRAWAIHYVMVVALALAFTGALFGRYSHRAFANRWLVAVGGMCYTTYLYHYALISLIGRTLRLLVPGNSYDLAFLLSAVVVVPIVLAVCSLLFVACERPFMLRNWPGLYAQHLRQWGWFWAKRLLQAARL